MVSPLSGPSIVVQSRRPFPACSRARPRRPCGIVSPARPWRPAAPASSRKRRWKRAARRRLSTCQRNRGRFRRIPRGGSGRTSHGVPRLPARCSRPSRGPAPARLLLGHGGPSLLPRSRCATRKRSLGVAFPARSARAARVPRTAAFDRLLMTAIIPPCRAPRALAAGFQTLPQGRLRKPSAHHPDGLARYALRRTNRRSYGLPVAMISPCAWRRGRANRSLRLAPAG